MILGIHRDINKENRNIIIILRIVQLQVKMRKQIK